jgi:two-component system response regulator RpaA
MGSAFIPPRPIRSGPRPRGPLVLVVEDEDAIREMYATELASAGFMVLEAADGATAVEKALQFAPHAVVLDLMLPGVDGFKVARRLRSDDRTRDVAIIALTGLASKKFEALALGSGCDSFMSKPFSTAALVGELVRLLARRVSGADMSRVVKR